MPTIMTHAVVAVGLGRIFTARKMPRLEFWEALIILSMLPDIDVFAFRFDVPYENMFGHRGFTHSIPFAFAISGIVAAFCCRKCEVRFLDLWGLFFVVTASHGLLDAATYGGGHGIAFLAPFSDERFWAPFRPMLVSQMGRHFVSLESLGTLGSEFVWVWIPMGLLVGAVELYRRIKALPPEAKAPTPDAPLPAALNPPVEPK